MRYLINLPLVIALASLAEVFDTAILSRTPRGGDAALGAAYAIFFGTFLTWIMLAFVIAACGAIGGFRWPRARGVAGLMVALIGYSAIVFIALQPLGIAMESNAARMFGASQATLSRVVAFGLPFVLLLYALWVVNAPAAKRDAPAFHGAALGAVALLCLVAAVVSVRELGHRAREAQADAAVISREADAQADQQRRDFATLTDADPLFRWSAYLSDNVPPDVRAEARRRIAARPQTEADLAQALASDNGNWSAEALWLIVKLPITPSRALVSPVRDMLAAFAEQLTLESKDVASDGGKRLDDYPSYRLEVILQVAERLAESAGADLRDSIDGVVRAVALYPKSDTAHWFPAKAADAKARIAKTLATRHE